MEIIDSLAPIFLLTALGMYLRNSKFLPDVFFSIAGKLIFRVSLPALLFLKISTASFALEMGDAAKVCLALLASMITVIPAAYIVAKILKLEKIPTGTFVLSSFRCNTAFVGLPVIMYTLNNDTSVQLATLAIAPFIPLSNITAIIVLSLANKEQKLSKGKFLLKTITSPLVTACFAALLWNALGLSMPIFINRSLNALGRTALPLALLSIGGAMATHTSFNIKRIMTPLAASLMNVFLLPLFGYFVCILLNLDRKSILITMIYLACPAASSGYVMVQQMKGDKNLIADTILISTLLAAPALIIILYLFK